jgi:hypothetical protein
VTAFYRTPAGQKFLLKAPSITQQTMVAGQKFGQSVGADAQKRMIEELRSKGPHPVRRIGFGPPHRRDGGRGGAEVRSPGNRSYCALRFSKRYLITLTRIKRLALRDSWH